MEELYASMNPFIKNNIGQLDWNDKSVNSQTTCTRILRYRLTCVGGVLWFGIISFIFSACTKDIPDVATFKSQDI